MIRRAIYDPENPLGSPDVALAMGYLPRDSEASITSHMDDPDQAIFVDDGMLCRIFLSRKYQRGRLVWLYPTGMNVGRLFGVVAACMLDLSGRFPEIAAWRCEAFSPDGLDELGVSDGGLSAMRHWQKFMRRAHIDSAEIEIRNGVAYLYWTFGEARSRILELQREQPGGP